MTKYSRTHRSIYKPKGRRISRRHIYEMPKKGGAGPNEVAGEAPAIAKPVDEPVEVIPTISDDEKPLPASSTDEEVSEEQMDQDKTGEGEQMDQEKTGEEEQMDQEKTGEKKPGVWNSIVGAISGATNAASRSLTDTTEELTTVKHPSEEPSSLEIEPSEPINFANDDNEAGFVNTEDKTLIEELKRENQELKEKNEQLTNDLFKAKDEVIDVLKQTVGLSETNTEPMGSQESLEEIPTSNNFSSEGLNNENQFEPLENIGLEEAKQMEPAEPLENIGLEQANESVLGEDNSLMQNISPQSTVGEEMTGLEKNTKVEEVEPINSNIPSISKDKMLSTMSNGPAPMTNDQVPPRVQGGKSKRRRRTIRKSRRRYRYVYA